MACELDGTLLDRCTGNHSSCVFVCRIFLQARQSKTLDSSASCPYNGHRCGLLKRPINGHFSYSFTASQLHSFSLTMHKLLILPGSLTSNLQEPAHGLGGLRRAGFLHFTSGNLSVYGEGCFLTSRCSASHASTSLFLNRRVLPN